MKRSTAEVEHQNYWTLRIRDEYRPDGEEWYKRFETKEQAEEELEKLIRRQLVTRVGEEVEIPDWD